MIDAVARVGQQARDILDRGVVGIVLRRGGAGVGGDVGEEVGGDRLLGDVADKPVAERAISVGWRGQGRERAYRARLYLPNGSGSAEFFSTNYEQNSPIPNNIMSHYTTRINNTAPERNKNK